MQKLTVSLIIAVFIVTISAAAVQGGQRQISIRINQERSVQGIGMKIKFLGVAEDSRCPEDTQCIWAGNAKIKIQLRMGKNQPQTYDLNSMTEPKIITFAGYDISLANLTPRPRSNIRINRNGYVATLTVRKRAK